MNKIEAKEINAKELQAYRVKPYCELIKLIDTETRAYDVSTKDGPQYQIEIQVFWDDKPG